MAYKVIRCLLPKRLKEANMSQQELANRMKVTRQQINKYARNTQIMSLPVAKEVSDILGCSIDDLYEWEVGKSE